MSKLLDGIMDRGVKKTELVYSHFLTITVFLGEKVPSLTISQKKLTYLIIVPLKTFLGVRVQESKRRKR